MLNSDWDGPNWASAALMSEALKMMGMPPMEDPTDLHFSIPLDQLPRDTESAQTKFCQSCAGLTVEALRREQGYTHKSNIRDLDSSADTCSLCKLLVEAIRQHVAYITQGTLQGIGVLPAVTLMGQWLMKQDRYLVDPPSVVIRLDNHTSKTMGSQELWVGLPSLRASKTANGSLKAQAIGVSFTFGKLLLHTAQDDKAQPLLPRGDERSIFRRLSAWLEKSRKDSEWLSPKRNYLPTRILDIGSAAENPSSIRLVRSSGLSGDYVALSYCWGAYQACRTLTSNINLRMANIRLEELPPVFAEAIYVTRGLGVRYLWIDALCIIQDDLDDWRYEASLMADVYSQCACRIAVTDSKSAKDSFFPPNEIVASILVPHLRSDIPSLMEKESSSKKSYITLPRWYRRDVDEAHLNSRGWVLQERMLAPRTIHFTRNHIYCEDQDDLCGEDWVRRRST